MPLPLITPDDYGDPLLAVSATTRRLYDRLPEYVRDADALQDPGGPTGRPLLRFLAVVVDQAGELERLTDRIAGYDTGSSALVNPSTADAAWLPWLAGLVGVPNPRLLGPLELRAAITNIADRRTSAGSLPSIIAAAQTATLGDVLAVRRYGGTFGIRLTALEATTPDADAVTAAIDAAETVPAGHGVIFSTYDDATRRARAAGITSTFLARYFATPSTPTLSLALDAAAVVEERVRSGTGWRERHPRGPAMIYLSTTYR